MMSIILRKEECLINSGIGGGDGGGNEAANEIHCKAMNDNQEGIQWWWW